MIDVQVPGFGLIQFPDGTPSSVIQAAIQRKLQESKRAELAQIRDHGDIGHEDVGDEMKTSRWNMMPSVDEQSTSQRYLRETVLDRGFGAVVGGLESGAIQRGLGFAVGGGVGRKLGDMLPRIPEGTRAAMRENQAEAADDYMVAHPEGGLGRAVTLSLGDVGASVAGPQALLGAGAGALAGKAALGAGASPAAARVAGFAGGALEGGAQSYLDSPDLTPEARLKSVAIGAGLGGLGAMKGIKLPEDDGPMVAQRRAPAAPDPTQPRPPRLSEQELALYKQEQAAVPHVVQERMAAYEARGKQVTPEDVQSYSGVLLRQVDQKWAIRFAELAAQEDSSKVRIAADDLAVKLAPEVKAPPRVVKAFGQEFEVDFSNAELGAVGPLGKKPAAPQPARPSDSVIAHDITETSAPYSKRLKSFYDRFVEEFSDKEVGPGRMLRRHDLPAEAAHVDKLIAYNRAAVAAAELPLFQGVERFDPKTGMRTRTYDPLSAILGGHDDPAIRDLNDLMAAEHHLELVGRQERAALEYDMGRARRLEEMRQARMADKTSLRAMTGDIRDTRANELRSVRQAARAGGEARGRLAGERALRGEAEGLRQRAGHLDDEAVIAAERTREVGFDESSAEFAVASQYARRLLREELKNAVRKPAPGSVHGLTVAAGPRSPAAALQAEGAGRALARVAERMGLEEGRVAALLQGSRSLRGAAGSVELAAGRQGDAALNSLVSEAGVDLLGAARDSRHAITSAQRVAMGIRDEATRFRQRFPPVERPPDVDLHIDPEGTAAAKAILTDLHQRYGTDGAGRVAMFDQQGRNIPDRVREWSYHAVIQPLIDSGFLSQGQADAVMGKNERYAPFFRMMDEISADGTLEVLSGSTNAKPIRKISGGLGRTAEEIAAGVPLDANYARKIAPPLESFVQQAQKVTVFNRRQTIRNMLGDLAEVHPDTVGQEIVKVQGAGGPDSFPVYRDGKATYYKAPADVMMALQRLTPKQAGIVLQIGQAAARLSRAGNTLTPDFARNNFIKDQWSAAVYGREYGYIPFVDAVHGLFEIFRKGDAYLGFLSGSAMSEMVSYGREATLRTLDDVRGKGGAWGTFRRSWNAETNKVAKLIYPVLYPLETVSKYSELSTRVGAYRRAKLRGATDLDAAVFARDITLDFGRSGTFGQRWNGVEAFANANLQDVARFRKAMSNPRTAFGTTVKALTYITLPALINHFANTPDDDVAEQYKQEKLAFDRKQGPPPDALLKQHPELHYADLPEWEKVAFMHVGWREDGRPWRIPRVQGLLNLTFGYGVEKTLDAIKGSDPDAWKDIRNSLLQETPLRYLNPMEGFLPSAVQPIVEAGANYSAFKNGPVVPPSQNRVLPEDRFTDQTTSIARWGGRLTGTSPVKIDYLIRGYLGTMGVYAAQGASAGLDAAAGAMPGAAQAVGYSASQLPPLPTQAQDIPGVKGSVGSPSTGFASKPVSDLYTVAQVASQAKESYDNALETGDALNAARIMREHPELMVLDALEDGVKQLRELRKERQAVRHDTSLTPQQRLDALMKIDLLVTQIAGARMLGVAEELSGVGKKLSY